MNPILVTLPATDLSRAVESMFDVLSNLESQIARNPDLPTGYRDTLARGFERVRWLSAECDRQVAEANGPKPTFITFTGDAAYQQGEGTSAVISVEGAPASASWHSDPATMDPVGDLERAIGRPLRRSE